MNNKSINCRIKKLPSYMQKYDRWEPIDVHSWPYDILCQYETEMKRLEISYSSASKYTYSHLKSDGALWTSRACNFMYTHGNTKITIKEWSDTYDSFGNWIRLNCIMVMSSYFETYIATAIKLALESDPGLLINCPHKIDGVSLLVEGKSLRRDEIETILMNCTKGDWQSRIHNMKCLFTVLPNSFDTYLSELETMRNFRNKVGPAFGRDIEDSRNYSLTKKLEMVTLSQKRLFKWQYMIKKIVEDFDTMLMQYHIGNFQFILLYHEIQDKIQVSMKKDEKSKVLKNHLVNKYRKPFPKDFYLWIITYYDILRNETLYNNVSSI